MNVPEHYPEILTDIAQLLHTRLHRHLPADEAQALALTLTEDLRRTFGGCQIYIPKGDIQQTRPQRDDAIFHSFNGRNHAELARRYNLTVARIYAILAQQRQTRQPGLF